MPPSHHTSHPLGAGAPRAIVICGPAGSGKSTLASALASALGWAIADLDTVTGPLTQIALDLSPDSADGLDSPAGRRLRAARYATLLDVSAANLALGVGVVLAAPFTRERTDPALWQAVVWRLEQAIGSRLDRDARPGAVALLYVSAPPELLHQRLAARAERRDGAKLRHGPRPAAAERLVPEAIVLDGAASADVLRDAALDALRRGAGGAAASGAPAAIGSSRC